MWQRSAQRAELFRIAGSLGYQPDGEIAQVSRCWDIFSHCGLFLYFRSDLPIEQLRERIDHLDFKVISAGEIDGHQLFTAINLGTPVRLTVGGQDGLGDRRGLPAFPAYEWRLNDRQGRRWTVNLYAIRGVEASFALDGQPLETNIVSILYQIR